MEKIFTRATQGATLGGIIGGAVVGDDPDKILPGLLPQGFPGSGQGMGPAPLTPSSLFSSPCNAVNLSE